MADQDSQLSSSSRVKGTTIVRPILLGNTSRLFGKKREEDGHTHSWTIYVKPYYNEDISIWVKRVQFKLHESYPNHQRVINQPPFEVTESGWGEFEVTVKIFFHDANDKPVTTYHVLKLFQTDATGAFKKNIVSEHYEEIIFTDPTVTMHQLLTQEKVSTTPRQDAAHDYGEMQEQTLARVAAAQSKIEQEIRDLRDKIHHTKTVLPLLNSAIAQLPRVPTVSASGGDGSVTTPPTAASAGPATAAPASAPTGPASCGVSSA